MQLGLEGGDPFSEVVLLHASCPSRYQGGELGR